MSPDKSLLYEALFELSQAISGHPDLDSLCQAFSGALKKIINFDELGLVLFNTLSDTYELYGISLPWKPDERVRRMAPGHDNPAGWVWLNQKHHA